MRDLHDEAMPCIPAPDPGKQLSCLSMTATCRRIGHRTLKRVGCLMIIRVL